MAQQYMQCNALDGWAHFDVYVALWLLLQVTIMKANGIKAYCGYTENWDQLRISTNSTSFGVNSTDWTTLATDELGKSSPDERERYIAMQAIFFIPVPPITYTFVCIYTQGWDVEISYITVPVMALVIIAWNAARVMKDGELPLIWLGTTPC